MSGAEHARIAMLKPSEIDDFGAETSFRFGGRLGMNSGSVELFGDGHHMLVGELARRGSQCRMGLGQLLARAKYRCVEGYGRR